MTIVFFFAKRRGFGFQRGCLEFLWTGFLPSGIDFYFVQAPVGLATPCRPSGKKSGSEGLLGGYCSIYLSGQGVFDLQKCNLSIHNCSKELKNQSTLRALAVLPPPAECPALQQSGHSQEDIDQRFSQMASFLEAEQETQIARTTLLGEGGHEAAQKRH